MVTSASDVSVAAYLDESGTHDDSLVLVVGAVVSPVFQWERLTESWQRILDSHGLPAFHTVDCAHRRNAFRSWSRRECSGLYRRLVALVRKHVLWRSWTAVVLPEYFKIFSDEPSARRMAYTLCAMGCASRIKRLALDLNVLVPYVFEHGGRGGGYTVRTLRDLIKNGQHDFYRMSSLSLDTRDRLVPLQVADLYAYETHKYFVDQLRDSDAVPRKSFRELLHIPEAGNGGYLYDEYKLRLLCNEIRDKQGMPEKDIPVDPLNHRVRTCIRWTSPDEN